MRLTAHLARIDRTLRLFDKATRFCQRRARTCEPDCRQWQAFSTATDATSGGRPRRSWAFSSGTPDQDNPLIEGEQFRNEHRSSRACHSGAGALSLAIGKRRSLAGGKEEGQSAKSDCQRDRCLIQQKP